MLRSKHQTCFGQLRRRHGRSSALIDSGSSQGLVTTTPKRRFDRTLSVLHEVSVGPLRCASFGSKFLKCLSDTEQERLLRPSDELGCLPTTSLSFLI
jgi:hypothetical protein